jgi:3-keto-5-aminohexanoate cleavage enzyme
MATTLDRFADRKPGWDTPVMIESHQNGVRTKAMNPNTPVTYEEVETQEIAREVGRPLATHEEAKRIYNIK